MAISKETKLAIKAKLRLGAKPQQLAEQFDIGIQTIYGINKILKEEMEDEQAAEIASIPMEVITHVVEEAKNVLPMPTPGAPSPMIEALDSLVDNVGGLKQLDMNFQTTMTNVLKRFDLALMEQDLPLKDVKLIADTTAAAYEKVFNAGTNIHIGDNNSHSTQQLTVFKSKQGV